MSDYPVMSGDNKPIVAAPFDRQFRSSRAGMFTDREADLKDTSHITATTGTVAVGGGSLVLSANSRATIDVQPMTGTYFVYMYVSEASGTFRARALSPTVNATPSNTRNITGHHVFVLQNLLGSSQLDVLTGSGGGVVIEHLQLFAAGAELAKPSMIIPVLGQSNMAATTSSLGISYREKYTQTNAFYVPGADYTLRGATEGVRIPMTPPFVVPGAVANGLSPAYSMAQLFSRMVQQDHSVTLVTAAESGTTLADDWNPAGSANDTYDKAVSLISTAIASAPAGSYVPFYVWSQGEGDTSADMSGYPADFAAFRSAIETATGTGAKPWLIAGPPPDATRANQDEFVRIQAAMDAYSGSDESQPNVHYVPRMSGYMEDSTHVNADGQDLMGVRLAWKAQMLGLHVAP